MSKYNILIVEDHALTRFALRTAFETEFETYSDSDSRSKPKTKTQTTQKVFEAENATKAFKILEKESVEIVLMDLGLPGTDGIEATKTIKEKHPSIKVVILSSHEQEEEVIKALKAGASAYCTKDIAPEKLIEIVESILHGAAWFDPKVAQYVLRAATSNNTPDQQKVTDETTTSSLTSREKQVLKLISDGLSNSEIAKKLEVSINTTKAHVCNILHKLGVQDRTQAAIKALKDNII